MGNRRLAGTDSFSAEIWKKSSEISFIRGKLTTVFNEKGVKQQGEETRLEEMKK